MEYGDVITIEEFISFICDNIKEEDLREDWREIITKKINNIPVGGIYFDHLFRFEKITKNLVKYIK